MGDSYSWMSLVQTDSLRGVAFLVYPQFPRTLAAVVRWGAPSCTGCYFNNTGRSSLISGLCP